MATEHWLDTLSRDLAATGARRGFLRIVGVAAVAAFAGAPPAAAKKAPTICAGDQTLCHNKCVDTATDEKHCGDCGVKCRHGEVCLAGDCVEAGSTICSANVCTAAEQCCNVVPLGGGVCCAKDDRCCTLPHGGNTCCPKDTICCSGDCCTADEQCCGGYCCPKGSQCCTNAPSSGICCPPGQTCSHGACVAVTSS